MQGNTQNNTHGTHAFEGRPPPDTRPCTYTSTILGDLLQRRVTQQQALLFRAEADLRHGLITATLDGEHTTLTELGVAHGIANRQGRNFLALMHAGTVRHL